MVMNKIKKISRAKGRKKRENEKRDKDDCKLIIGMKCQCFNTWLTWKVCMLQIQQHPPLRHMSGEPAYGEGNITVRVMNADGSVLPGSITKEMGYVSWLSEE